MTDKGVYQKANIDFIANLIINTRINNSLFGLRKKHGFIAGSFVYKYLVRNESVNDIDVLCPSKNYNNFVIFCQRILKNSTSNGMSARNYTGKNSEGYSFTKYTNIMYKTGTNSEINVDVIDAKEFIEKINEEGLSHINALVLTKEGVRHIFEVPELSQHLVLGTENGEKERKWILETLKNKQYCKWKFMRSKDTEYFKGWSVIDCDICKNHGIFQ